MTNDFAQLDAQSDVSRMAFVTPEEHAEYQAYLDAQNAQAPAQLQPCTWDVEDLGDDDCRKEVMDLYVGNVRVAGGFNSVAGAQRWANANGYVIQNPPRFLWNPSGRD